MGTPDWRVILQQRRIFKSCGSGLSCNNDKRHLNECARTIKTSVPAKPFICVLISLLCHGSRAISWTLGEKVLEIAYFFAVCSI